MSSYVLKTIRMDPLDVRSVEKAIREVERTKRELNDAMTALVRALMDDGVETAKMEVVALDAVDTGALLASIGHGAYDPGSRTGVVYAGGYYAIFVEYGTGIVGEKYPHPAPETASQGQGGILGMQYTKYDTNNHGEQGWWYYSDTDGKRHWTKGMKSRPFMYNTMMYLRDYAERAGGRIIASYVAGGGGS